MQLIQMQTSPNGSFSNAVEDLGSNGPTSPDETSPDTTSPDALGSLETQNWRQIVASGTVTPFDLNK